VVAVGPAAALRARVPRARPGALASLAGGRVVVGTEAGELRVYAAAGDDSPRVHAAHEGPVVCVSGGPDGRTLLSAGEDGALAVWRVGAGGELTLVERRAVEATGDRVRSLTPLAGGDVLIGTGRGVGVRCRWPR
jgi:WD40 repeat protein